MASTFCLVCPRVLNQKMSLLKIHGVNNFHSFLRSMKLRMFAQIDRKWKGFTVWPRICISGGYRAEQENKRCAEHVAAALIRSEWISCLLQAVLSELMPTLLTAEAWQPPLTSILRSSGRNGLAAVGTVYIERWFVEAFSYLQGWKSLHLTCQETHIKLRLTNSPKIDFQKWAFLVFC